MRLLNDFINKIRDVSYIYNSEEFQVFIRVSADYKKNENKEKPIIEIAEEYKNIFSEFLFMRSTDDGNKIIQEALQTFSGALGIFENFEKTCKVHVDNFCLFETGMNSLVGGILEIMDFYSETYALEKVETQQREGFTNPYIILLNWARGQILDLQAVVDAVAKRNSIEKMKTIISEKYEKDLKILNKTRLGKKKILQIFSKKSKEDNVREQETLVQNLEIEIKAVELICTINTERLVQKDLPEFKRSKLQMHESMLRAYSQAMSSEFDQLNEQLRPLSEFYKGLLAD